MCRCSKDKSRGKKSLGIIGIALTALLSQPICSPALAQTGQPLVPLGYCQLTSLAAAAALSACAGGIPAGTNAVLLRAETQALRFRADGTNPTAAIGMPLATTDPSLFLMGGVSAMRFIEQVASGKLNVIFFRAPQ